VRVRTVSIVIAPITGHVRKCTASALPNPTDVHHIWRVGEPRRPEPPENPLGELMHKSPHPTTLGRDGFVRLCAQAAPRLFRQSRSDMGHERRQARRTAPRLGSRCRCGRLCSCGAACPSSRGPGRILVFGRGLRFALRFFGACNPCRSNLHQYSLVLCDAWSARRLHSAAYWRKRSASFSMTRSPGLICLCPVRRVWPDP
jgi:hypothetical protein